MTEEQNVVIMNLRKLIKEIDGGFGRYKSWQQHPTRHQLYGHLPPITKTIQVIRTRHAGHCWRSRDELIRDVLLWIPTHGRAKAGRPARTYIQQLCEDTGCCPEDLPRAMNDREEWRERVRDIRAASTIWWWWCFVLMLCDIYAIVEKGRVYVVDKMNVERWGLFLILIKTKKLWRRVWGFIDKDGMYIVWRVWWLVEENGTCGALVFFSYLRS